MWSAILVFGSRIGRWLKAVFTGWGIFVIGLIVGALLCVWAGSASAQQMPCTSTSFLEMNLETQYLEQVTDEFDFVDVEGRDVHAAFWTSVSGGTWSIVLQPEHMPGMSCMAYSGTDVQHGHGVFSAMRGALADQSRLKSPDKVVPAEYAI